jgi:antitoxin (DNA-binding transcriptional repressor) of toxin-antitoxin stability system
MENLVGLKELRQNVDKYAAQVTKGKSFVVLRRSTPLFKITPFEDEEWETLIDFTKIRRDGIPAKELLSMLKNA